MIKKIILLVFLAYSVFSQQYKLRGSVSDSINNSPLGFASVRIGGTQYGTSTNTDGEFILMLDGGKHKIIFSYIGYRSDTINVGIPEITFLDVGLSPQSILLPEVVVNDEDPAYRIIREAIRRKEINKRGLQNFEYDAYSKKIVKSVGELALIEETFVKGYNKVGEWEKEFLISVYKTENIKNQSRNIDFTITSSYFVDFSSDTLSLFMNLVYLPIATDAFDYYDYKLLKTNFSDETEIYEIQVIPKSTLQPLLMGTIAIDSDDYALNSVNLKTNEGIRFPYINNLKAEFSQRLNKYYNYYLPQYVEYSASMEINLQGLIKIGTLEFNQLSNITNYVINPPIPDSIKNAQRSKYGFFAVDTSRIEKPTLLSKNEIDSLREIPLTQKEVKAFETLDSTKTVEKMIKVEGALTAFISEDDNSDSVDGIFGTAFNYTSNYLEFRNNRVTGILLGLKYNDEILKDMLSLNASYGYSFERDAPEGHFYINYMVNDLPISDIRLKIYNKSMRWQIYTPYPDIVNSVGVTLGLEDHFNFYLAKGFGFGLGRSFGKNISASLEYTNEKQESLPHTKYKSLISPKRFVRPNPEISSGKDIRGTISISLGNNPLEIQLLPKSGLIAQLDYSSSSMNSDFDYRRYRVIGMFKTNTFLKELFVSPYIHFLVDAALIEGNYGPQHIFTPITAYSFYSPIGSFKGLKPYQLSGTEMVSVHFEHNWRTIPFQAFGLDFISDLHIDIITGISGLKIWNNSSYFVPNDSQNNSYWETYLSFSRIFAFTRIDFSYSSLKKFAVSASIGVLL